MALSCSMCAQTDLWRGAEMLYDLSRLGWYRFILPSLVVIYRPPWFLWLTATKDGFFMPSLSDSSRSDRSSFHQVVASFLSQPGLPFTKILSAVRIERIFRRHGNLFGESPMTPQVSRFPG